MSLPAADPRVRACAPVVGMRHKVFDHPIPIRDLENFLEDANARSG